MELKDTVSMMTNSDDYIERFKAEYYQLKVRLDKLNSMLEKWDKKELSFKPTCQREIYNQQVMAMSFYLETLKLRANIEGIVIYDN